ncbi:SDR family oxidoreductase [Shouchella hunanensis]|uniref:SDR family oxidoreductase n=1 Tax=Shouchella hunanensis TaxID=766894 RepID=A0ABY7W9H7_9BACI|nr:SDR family oxidoreductase [Shouchella hunanensis]WDF05539.1 SDR family oxidoreductase [Shouchella hunanensis]
MENIKGKVIVITGASRGIGRANAIYLSNLGAKVVIGDLLGDRLETVKDEIRSNKNNVIAKTTDVTKRTDIEELVSLAVEHFGRVDVLISCAGVIPQSYLYKNEYEDWENAIDVNIKGILYGIGAVLPIMHKQETGHIINISSIGAYNVGPGGAVYSATKHAVRAITEGLRQEEAEVGKNVRVMSVSPGSIDTEFTHSIKDKEIRAQFDKLSEDAIEPESVARIIAFAINEEKDVGLNEVIIRPSNQVL